MGYGTKYGSIYGLEEEGSPASPSVECSENVNDTLEFEDNISVSLTSEKTIEDIIVITDQFNVGLETSCALQDSLVLTDAFDSNLDRLLSIQDSLQLTGQSTLQFNSLRSIEDAIEITDPKASSIVRTKTLVPVVNTLFAWDDWGNNGHLTGYGSAAVFDDHGNILIGFPSKYYDSGGGLVAWCGAVYVQNPETGDLVQLIYPEAADILAYGMFGYTIACSGNWMVVGEAFSGTRVPHIYFYEWNGSAYVYRQKLQSYHAQDDTGFGGTLVMDGSLCCAGNRWSKNSKTEGSVDIFRLSGGVWSEDVGSEILYPGASPGYKYFSRALGLSGSYLIVGASGLPTASPEGSQGAAYIFEDVGAGNPFALRATFLPSGGMHGSVAPAWEGRYGQCVAIHDDIAVVSWPTYHYLKGDERYGIGCLDVYKREGSAWPFQQRLELPEASDTLEPSEGSAWLGGKAYGGMGQEAIQFNGSTLVAGAARWQRGAHPGGWYPSGMLGAGFVWGRNSADDFSSLISASGEYAIFPGAVYGPGWPVAINDADTIALMGLQEIDEWSTARALPEADPVDTWGGTVRIYKISTSVNPKYSLIVERNLQDNVVFTDSAYHTFEYGRIIPTDTLSFTDSLSVVIKTDPIVELYKTQSVWNQFDEYALLVGLRRLKGEKNWSLKRRTLDVFARHANSSYQGLIYGITRELGLSLFKPLIINPVVDINGVFLANDPYVYIDGTFLYLYSDYSTKSLEIKLNIYEPGGHFEHLTKIVDYINDNSDYFEASVVSGYEYTKSATFLNQSNRILIKGEALPITTKFQLDNRYIVNGSILFNEKDTLRQEVENENEVIARGQYWINYTKGIMRAFTYPSLGTNIRYEYTVYPFHLVASPVILQDINSTSFKIQLFEQILSTNGNYLNGNVTELGADIINELYSVTPMYWGK